MKLIIGLGNPGKEYEKTRHNIGFRIVDELSELNQAQKWKKSSKANVLVTDIELEGKKVFLMKPQTFMNLSGGAIAHIIQYYKLNPEKDIIVCFDDKDIIFGDIRLREKGSSGGHNGIKSIIAAIGTESFHRLKYGIGHDNQHISTHDFVLQRFNEQEEIEIPDLIEKSITLIKDWLIYPLSR